MFYLNFHIKMGFYYTFSYFTTLLYANSHVIIPFVNITKGSKIKIIKLKHGIICFTIIVRFIQHFS